MILFYSSKEDLSALKLTSELKKRHIDYKWLDVADFMNPLHLAHKIGKSSGKPEIRLDNNGEIINLAEVSVIFVRSAGTIETNHLKNSPSLKHWVNTEARNYFREALEMLDCEWFPCKPSLLYQQETEKFSELNTALKAGLRIPDTIVTNNPQEALNFYRQHNGRVISKRYYKSKLPYKNVEFAYGTSPVSLRDIGFIHHIQNSPTLFQQYVPKLKELRVTVIGEQTITAEIDSQKAHHTRHDWRNYDRYRTPYSLHQLPFDIHTKLTTLVKMRGLCYGTCDMVITPEGDYVFLEINPAGQFAWIENTIGIDITGLICDELVNLAHKQKSK